MRLNLPTTPLRPSATLAGVRRAIRRHWPDIVRSAQRKGLTGPATLPQLDQSIRLLTTSRKTAKGLKVGQLTGVLYLPPAAASGVQLCQWRSKGCERSCLGPQGNGQGSGQLALPSAYQAAHYRAALLLGSPALFGALLVLESRALASKAERLGLDPSIRVNGSSDLPTLATWLARHAPASVRLYDYTKSEAAAQAADGVHRTFSYSGYNQASALRVLQSGGNVAVVFSSDPRKDEPKPAAWQGFPTLDADQHDARYLDSRGHVAALGFKQAKGRAQALAAAGKFVVQA